MPATDNLCVMHTRAIIFNELQCNQCDISFSVVYLSKNKVARYMNIKVRRHVYQWQFRHLKSPFLVARAK